MLNFPYLTTLVRKNANYQGLFPRATKLQNNQGLLKHSNYNEGQRKNNRLSGYGDGDTGHMTKNITAAAADTKRKVPDAIWDTTFLTQQFFNQQDRKITHISTGKGKNQKFGFTPCYIEFMLPNFFEERTTFLPNGDRLECNFCRRWFDGRIKEKIKVYLEGLRVDVGTTGISITANKTDTEAPGTAESMCNDVVGKHGRKDVSKSKQFCEFCAKILSNRNSLGRHMLIHSGEKPFPCDVCGRPFRRKDNCARHKRSAHLFKKIRKSQTLQRRNLKKK